MTAEEFVICIEPEHKVEFWKAFQDFLEAPNADFDDDVSIRLIDAQHAIGLWSTNEFDEPVCNREAEKLLIEEGIRHNYICRLQ